MKTKGGLDINGQRCTSNVRSHSDSPLSVFAQKEKKRTDDRPPHQACVLLASGEL